MMKEAVKVAKELISRDDIDVIIGYEKGRAPFQNVPLFARNEEDCEKLVFDPLCAHNLVTYLKNFKGKKVALFAKPCDIKSIIGLLQENQITRDMVHIIGLNCQGTINVKNLLKDLKGKEIKKWRIVGDSIFIEGNDLKEELYVKDYYMEKCHSCTERSPKLYDQILGEDMLDMMGSTQLEEINQLMPGFHYGGDFTIIAEDEYERTNTLEKLSAREKQNYWNKEFSKCIRCYACVKTCPLCYCEKCFVESSKPQWINKSTDLKSNKAFHIIRAFHLAGRCIGCGECDRACPVNIPLSELNIKLKKSVQEHFEYTAGEDPEITPPLSTFKKEDREEFIR